MSEVTITGIDVQLKAIRVGTKQVTKLVWNQFPFRQIEADDDINILGWVNVERFTDDYVPVLYVLEGKPMRTNLNVEYVKSIDLPQLFIGV